MCRKCAGSAPVRYAAMAREKSLEAPPYSAAPVEVLRLPGSVRERDQVAIEEPLEIRIGGRSVAVTMRTPGLESRLQVPFALLVDLPERLRAAQAAFAATGGLHATGLYDSTGELLCLREDVGRHNAMDKVVGWAYGAGLLPLARSVLCVSGRLSFELVQKAAVAGCPILVAVGAPSSLAVELAADRGITLCGFVRGGRVNVYTEAWRVAE